MKKQTLTKAAKQTASDFLSLARMVFTDPTQGKLVVEVTDEQIIAFHKMDKAIRANQKYTQKVGNLINVSYPFLKIDGVWYMSTMKMYMYLFFARSVLANFKSEDIQRVHDGINAASKYYDDAKNLDAKLTPRDHVNLNDYQEKQAELYKNYLMVQSSIFGA